MFKENASGVKENLGAAANVDLKKHIHPFEACPKRAMWDRKFGPLYTKDVEK
jgi:hypothetical protein